MTPQSLRDVRFREKLRGYNPEDVDEYVTKTAALVESLQREVEELRARVAQAPPAAEVAPSIGMSDAEETLRRTLVLAQRTADLAIQEAREEAARIVAEAAAARDQLEAEVTATRDQLLGDARHEAETEMARLAQLRSQLQADVAELEGFASTQRERLRAFFSEALAAIEGGAVGIDTPPEVGAGAIEAIEAVEARPAVEVDIEVESAGDEIVPGPTGDDHDPFIAELRRAITDDAPLGPRDEPLPDVPDARDEIDFFRDDEESAGRLGSRLRRRK